MVSTAAQIVQRLTRYVIDPILLIIFSLGFLLFMWGLIEFLLKLDRGSDHKQGIEHMKWGIVGMVVMSSVGGIIALIDNTFGFQALSGGTANTTTLNQALRGFQNVVR